MTSNLWVVFLVAIVILIGNVNGKRDSKQHLQVRLVTLETELKQSKAHAHVMEQDLADMRNQMASLVNSQKSARFPETQEVTGEPPTGEAGAVYTRWGRHVCDGAGFVYEGIMSGSGKRFNGSGGNYLCLHTEPEWGTYMDGDDATTAGRGVIYGVEYHGNPDEIFDNANLVGTTFVEQNVPCAVCESARRNAVMFPGQVNCPSTWSLEYWGYLMSDNHQATGRTEFVCIDHAPEARDGGSQPQLETSNIYHVEARCGSLPCPQYIDNREITCVVCSK